MKILVADDDPTWRRINARYLAEAGHEVVEAKDELEAMAFFRQDINGYGAVVSDNDMVQQGAGINILKEMKELRPTGLRCVLITGRDIKTLPEWIDQLVDKADFSKEALLAAITA